MRLLFWRKKITCTGHGRARCLKDGQHSWFNHSMDSYYANPGLSNLPEGFVEP